MKRGLKPVVVGLLMVLLPALLAGCASDMMARSRAPMNTWQEGSSVPRQGLSGIVVETMEAGGYTYICLEADGTRSWVAVPTARVSLGDEIQVMPGTEMGRFTSKTLNRSFDSITFSPGFSVNANAGPRAGSPIAEVRNLLVGQEGERAVATFDLTSRGGEGTAEVTVAIIVNGKRLTSDQLSISGDFGHNVAVGSGKRIVWNAMADLPADFDGEVRWDVRAIETGH